MRLKEVLTYDDVLLVPQHSDIESRKEVDIGNDLDENIHLDLPIISAPMDTVTELSMAMSMAEMGGLGVVHRYGTIAGQCRHVSEARRQVELVGAAVGVTGDYLERALHLADSGAKVLCVDVAHGHHKLVERAIKSIKDLLHERVHIMAGNVATPEGYGALSGWGADSIRCNVGGGSICSTRIQTGHGMPGLQTILDCAERKRPETKIIADGGLKSSGDMVKALAAGADFVMVGSLLAGTDETPGDVIGTINSKKKVYRGMASKEAQFEWRGKYSSNEGISATIPYKGKIADILEDLKNGIASGLSYSGCRTIQELQENAIFIRQTASGLAESKPHILGKV
jgi:IMP dehydrogenase